MEVGGGGKRRQVFMFCLFYLAWLTDIFEFLFSRNIYLSFLSSLQFNSFIIGFHDHFKNRYTDTKEKLKNLNGCQDMPLLRGLRFYQFSSMFGHKITKTSYPYQATDLTLRGHDMY